MDGAKLSEHKGYLFAGVKIVDKSMVDIIGNYNRRNRGKSSSTLAMFDNVMCHLCNDFWSTSSKEYLDRQCPSKITKMIYNSTSSIARVTREDLEELFAEGEEGIL